MIVKQIHSSLYTESKTENNKKLTKNIQNINHYFLFWSSYTKKACSELIKQNAFAINPQS